MLVKFYEGAIGSNQLFETIDMPIVPRVGEHVAFEFRGDKSRFEIGWVEYVFEIGTVQQEFAVTFDCTGIAVKCGLVPN